MPIPRRTILLALFLASCAGAPEYDVPIRGGADFIGPVGILDLSASPPRLAPVPIPTPVVGGLSFLMLDTNDNNTFYGATCGVTNSGVPWCWGANQTDQLGTPSSDTCTFLTDTLLLLDDAAPDERRLDGARGGRWPVAHLRARHRGRRLVLGYQQPWRTGRRHDGEQYDSGSGHSARPAEKDQLDRSLASGRLASDRHHAAVHGTGAGRERRAPRDSAGLHLEQLQPRCGYRRSGHGPRHGSRERVYDDHRPGARWLVGPGQPPGPIGDPVAVWPASGAGSEATRP